MTVSTGSASVIPRDKGVLEIGNIQPTLGDDSSLLVIRLITHMFLRLTEFASSIKCNTFILVSLAWTELKITSVVLLHEIQVTTLI